MEQKTKITYMAAIVLALAMGVASFSAAAKSDNAKEGNAKTVSEKSNNGNSHDANAKSGEMAEDNSSKVKKDAAMGDLTEFSKPDKTKGETNAQLHEENAEKVKNKLKVVAGQEEAAGNTQVANEIQMVVAEEERTQAGTTEAINQVENRNKVKTFLLGTDYKNLGQLRSTLSHNENEVRQLTRTLSRTQDADSQAMLEEQIQVMMQERNRIKEVINTNQGTFSLFGWLSRFMNGYEPAPVDDQSEEQLENDVQEAIENAPAAEEENTQDDAADVTEADTTTTDTTGGTTDTTDNAATDNATTTVQ